MDIRAFFNGMIAIGLDNINELLAAKQLGMFLCDGNGYYFDDDVKNEDGVDREPTEEEKTNRAIDELRDGCRVFATMHAPNGYELVEKKSTTLQSNFFVGQQVYIMHENKICELYVQRVILTSSYACDNTSRPDDRGISIFAKDAVSKHNIVGVTERYLSTNKQQQLLLLAKKETWEHPRIKGQMCFAYHTFGVYPTDEVFTSKEELVKHLMEG